MSFTPESEFFSGYNITTGRLSYVFDCDDQACLSPHLYQKNELKQFKLTLCKRAKRNFRNLNSTPVIVAKPITNTPLMKGTVPKRLDTR